MKLCNIIILLSVFVFSVMFIYASEDVEQDDIIIKEQTKENDAEEVSELEKISEQEEVTKEVIETEIEPAQEEVQKIAEDIEQEGQSDVVQDEDETEVETEPVQEKVATEEEIKQEKKVEVEEESKPELEVQEPLGIDTVDLAEPQGNWLFKRIWWERAEERYEKINQLVQKMMEMRVNFFVKRADLDKKVLDPFYLQVGMNHSELLLTITMLIEQLEQEREDEGVLTIDQREQLELLEQERSAISQLQKDVESIQELDGSVDSALATLIETMNTMRQHERDAWVNFKEIARVLSEKKARELFYMIDASWQHIKKLRDYIEKEFGPYFAKLVIGVNEHIGNVQKEVDELKEKGIELKKSVELLTQKEEKPFYNYDDEDEDEDEYKETSWIGLIGDLIWSIITFPITLIKSIFGIFF